jgi:hypothetical protein
MEPWLHRLERFRLCLAQGGPANDGDMLMAAIRCESEEEFVSLMGFLEVPLRPFDPARAAGKAGALGAYPKYEKVGEAPIRGVPAYVLVRSDRVELLVFDYGDLEERHYQDAFRLEEGLKGCPFPFIDPPLDSERCICPKYHPGLWSPKA